MRRSVDEHVREVAQAIRDAAERRRIEPAGSQPVTEMLTGRLASPARSAVDIPGFDNSQMDGFAVHSADLVGARLEHVTLPTVAHVVAGGSPPPPLARGFAAPIMTGAPIPDGADAIVPVEHTSPGDFGPVDGGAHIVFDTPVDPATFIRHRGSDVQAGAVLLEAGAPLHPAAIGALVAGRVAAVTVAPTLRIAIIGTGSELVNGDVPNSNSHALLAHCHELGLDATTHVVPDEPDTLTTLFTRLASDHDVIITTGGVSAGAREVVRQSLSDTPGAWFGHVALQPGGPQGLALLRHAGREVPVVCLPGNPVSVLVSFELFVRPPLAEAAGRIAWRPAGTAPLAEPLTSPEGRLQVRRGRLDAGGTVRLVGEAGSHLVTSYARADVLLLVPESVTALSPGDTVEWWRIA